MIPDSRQSAAETPAQVAARLCDAGIIAHVAPSFSLPEITEIGDALLAAPALATIISLNDGDSPAAVAALRERAGEHMLVGVSNVRSAGDVERAATAGAQFLLSDYLDRNIAEAAHKRGVFYLPGVFTRREAQHAHRSGLLHLNLLPADVLGPEHLASLCAALPDCVFFAAGGISRDNVAAFAQAGAAALIAGRALIPARNWTQAEIITHVRAMRRAWADARF